MSKEIRIFEGHHVWCNYPNRNPKECSLCKTLWEKYPYNTSDEEIHLAEKHFPNATLRSGT